MPSLPALKPREARRFLARFTIEYEFRKNDKVAGLNLRGKTFLIELAHDGTMRPDILQHALRYLDVEREDFWSWYRSL